MIVCFYPLVMYITDSYICRLFIWKHTCQKNQKKSGLQLFLLWNGLHHNVKNMVGEKMILGTFTALTIRCTYLQHGEQEQLTLH